MAHVRDEAYDREEQYGNGGREPRRRGSSEQERDQERERYPRREAYGGGGDVLFSAGQEEPMQGGWRAREREQERFDERYGRPERFERDRGERFGGERFGGERFGGERFGGERFEARDERHGGGMREDRFEAEPWGRGSGREMMRGREQEPWGRGGGRMERERGHEPDLGMRQGRGEGEGFVQSTLRRIQDFIGKGPKGYTRTDERILEEVHERLSYGYLDASEIEVQVKGGEVTLKGTVNSKADRRIAEDAIDDVVGVKEVDNRLKVKRLESATASSSGGMRERSSESDKDRDESTRLTGSTPPHKRS